MEFNNSKTGCFTPGNGESAAEIERGLWIIAKTDPGSNAAGAGRAPLGSGAEEEKSFRAFSIGEL